MTSNYKKIGDFIRLVDLRNTELEVETLLGLSISKKFIPSVANTIGTNMANYKIIKKGQFACSLMQVRRDKKIPVSLQNDFDEAIISQAYPVFEVIDTSQIIPEYLMMWMSRSEFDRHACFLAVGGVRGSLEWDDFCDMELPIPPIAKQREIVCEYNVVKDHIALNEKITQKLEDTAKTIYKRWFIDFDFPISKKYAESIGKAELEGQPYQSSGGEIEYCEHIETYIPKEWGNISFTQLFNLGGGGTPSTVVPEYWNDDVFFFTGRDIKKCYYTLTTEKSISNLGLKKSSTKLYPKNTTFIVSRGATTGATALAGTEMAMNQSCYAVVSNNETYYFAHQTTLNLIERIKKSIFSGAIFNALVTKDFDEQFLPNPPIAIRKEFQKLVKPLYVVLDQVSQENSININLNALILSKMSKA